MHGVVLDRNRLDRGAIDFSPPQTTTRIADAAAVGSNKVILECDVPARAPNIKRTAVAAAGTPRNVVTP